MSFSRGSFESSLLNRSPLAYRAAASIVLLFALLFASTARAESIEQLKPQGYVNDFAGVLSGRARQQMTALCGEVDQKAHAQIAVVTIHSLDDVPVEDFANKLYERWGIGYKGENRGVLILLAVNDRKYRAEVGYGLEPILPDGRVGGFWREVVPTLRQGNYDAALLQLTARITQVIAADRGVTLGQLPEKLRRRPPQPTPTLAALIIFGFLFFIIFGLVLPAIAAAKGARRGRWGAGPWIGTGLWGSGGSGGGGWGGGSFGGGGGFGGFGGGMSGGGGASGSW